MNRFFSFLTLLIFVLVILLFGNVQIFATDIGFQTETLTNGEKDEVIKAINISMTKSELSKKSIDCFDVNKGMIAIGHNDSSNKTVSILEPDGSFLVGYYFECYGTFGIELKDDSVLIFLVRDQLTVEINFDGEIRNIERIIDSKENNSYWNNVVFANKKYENGICYEIKNNGGLLNLFAVSYSQLSVTEDDGQEKVIYDVSSSANFYTVVVLILIAVAVCSVLCCVGFTFIKLKKYKNSTLNLKS